MPRSTFEKLSLPAASAGRGAFLIEGYYSGIVSLGVIVKVQWLKGQPDRAPEKNLR